MTRDSHVLDDLSAYLDRELPDADRARVEAHLSACAGCAGDLTQLKAALGLVERVVAVEPSSGLRRRVLAAADRPRSLVERLRALASPKAWIPATVAAVAAAALIGGGGKGEQSALAAAEELAAAERLDLFADLDVLSTRVLGVEVAVEDLEVVARLHELED